MTAPATPNRRLDTWRQIGDYFGKDERTAKRWEATRALPVHRLPGAGNSAVFAYSDELEKWLAAGRAVAATASPELRREPATTTRTSGPERRRWSVPPFAIWTGLGVAAVAIVGATTAATFHAPVALLAPHIPKPVAVDLYRQGRSEWNRRTPESLKAALADFTQAAMQDSNYADAYVGLADTYSLLREYAGMPDEEAYPRAELAARRAVALDQRNAAAHAALAFVEFHWDWDVKAARRDFERAIALDPSSSTAHHWYATALMDIPDTPAALREIERAEALEPESVSIRADKGAILIRAGRQAEAERLLLHMAQADPSFLSPHTYLSILYRQQGRYGAYVRETAEVARLKGDDTSRRIAEALKTGYETSGATGLRKADLAIQETLYREGRIDGKLLAFTYAEYGDSARAVSILAAAVARHDADLVKLAAQPELASIKTQPKFTALLAQLH